MKNYLPLGILVCFCLASCHFYDDRVRVANNSEKEMLFAISILNPVKREDILSPFYKLKPGRQRSISLLKNLNYRFMDVDSVAILQITPEIEKNIIRNSGYYAYEQILKDKSYTYLNVSTMDIVESGGLEISYTSNSFTIPKD